MSDITSNWKLTHGATVLVDYGQMLAREFPFDIGNGTDVVASPDSAYPLLLDTGNATVTFSFTVFWDFPTDKEAAAALLNSLIFTAGSGIQILKLERSGYADRYWQYAQARITRSTPELMTNTDTARLAVAYSLTCVGPSYVGP